MSVSYGRNTQNIILQAASKQLLAWIEEYEGKVQRLERWEAVDLPRFPHDRETRPQELDRTRRWLETYRRAYEELLKQREQFDKAESKEFAQEVANYLCIRGQQPTGPVPVK
jgi:hypothetical protein